jgi:hypothetical protein
MNQNAEDPQNDNSGHDGFIWSQRLTVITGIILAAVVAAAQFAPALATPLEWLPR